MQRTEIYTGEDRQTDFTHILKAKGVQYLLLWVDMFTGWIEAFPKRTEKMKEVVRSLVNEFILSLDCPRACKVRKSPQLWEYSTTSIAIGDPNPQRR